MASGILPAQHIDQTSLSEEVFHEIGGVTIDEKRLP